MGRASACHLVNNWLSCKTGFHSDLAFYEPAVRKPLPSPAVRNECIRITNSKKAAHDVFLEHSPTDGSSSVD